MNLATDGGDQGRWGSGRQGVGSSEGKGAGRAWKRKRPTPAGSTAAGWAALCKPELDPTPLFLGGVARFNQIPSAL